MLKTYSTTQGDVWDLISYRQYQDEGFIHELIVANYAHRHTVIFPADVVLVIPDRPAPNPESPSLLPPWV